MASLTQCTWVCVDSRSWWWTGRPHVLLFIGSQRVGHNWATELSWTELLYNIVVVFAIHWHESAMGIHVSPILNTPPPPSPSHLSGSSQCTSPEHPVSYIEPGLAIYFTYGNIHVSMLVSQIIPPLSSPTESKSLFFTSVSLLLSHIQGYHYYHSKFHLYALVYCIGVFLSGLLHSV